VDVAEIQLHFRVVRALAVVFGLLTLLAGQQQVALPRVITLEGELTYGDYERLFERAFDVPPGTRRIEISYDVTGGDRRTVVDLGLRGPSGLRGWSGGGKSAIAVSALTATPGYLPGPIEPGGWAVLLGVPNIRNASRDRYTVTVRLFDTDLAPFTRVIRPGPGWFGGDLHAHSGHSDGRSQSASGVSIPTPAHRVFDAAQRAGLDFVLLSEHNTASHWLDVDRLQPYFDTMLLLHGREVTTYRGHANTVGERQFAEFRLPEPAASPAPLLEAIATSGAFISVNHPMRPDDETCMGCGWNVIDDAVMRSVHGVEVVNGTTRTGPMSGWGFWARLMNAGHRVVAVGGSDDHTIDSGDDARLGQPATLVYARELSENAIVEGLKSGRVYVRTFGMTGPTLDFSATDPLGRRYEMGMSLPAGEVTLGAETVDAKGQSLEWIRNGSVINAVTIGSEANRFATRGSPGDWFSVVIRDRRGEPTVMSNAIRVSAFQPRP
jgi:predicted metal-dependent phosphoesterase TrpH